MSLSRRWRKALGGPTRPDPVSKSRWEFYRQLLEVLGIWIEAIGVLTAAVIAIQQYQENSRAEQVNKTLKYLDRFQEDRVFNARRTLEQAWHERRNEVFEIESAQGEAALVKFLEDEIEKQHLEPLIATVMDFYDELHACTMADLCDRDTAVRFFGKYAWDFYGLLAPHIKSQRAQMHDDFIGLGVRFFSRAYREFTDKQQSPAKTTSGPPPNARPPR
ncbi:MAG: hypothetical protein U1E83_08220 [Methylotetracoccus sp.]